MECNYYNGVWLTFDGSRRVVVAYGPCWCCGGCRFFSVPLCLNSRSWLTSAYSETRPCNLLTKILAALVFLALFSNMTAIGSSTIDSLDWLLPPCISLLLFPFFQFGSNHKWSRSVKLTWVMSSTLWTGTEEKNTAVVSWKYSKYNQQWVNIVKKASRKTEIRPTKTNTSWRIQSSISLQKEIVFFTYEKWW